MLPHLSPSRCWCDDFTSLFNLGRWKVHQVTRSKLMLAGILFSAALAHAQADEGMWTFNNSPIDKIEKAYGFRPDQQWLDHIRLSSVRLAQGCSGSFVSGQGLVQTN